MASTVGTASARKQRLVNVVIFSAVAVCFFIEIFHALFSAPDYVGKAALAIAIFLISVKLGYYLHNAVKFNHYTFWVFASLESRLLEIKKQLDECRQRLDMPDKEEAQDPS